MRTTVSIPSRSPFQRLAPSAWTIPKSKMMVHGISQDEILPSHSQPYKPTMTSEDSPISRLKQEEGSDEILMVFGTADDGPWFFVS